MNDVLMSEGSGASLVIVVRVPARVVVCGVLPELVA